MVAKHFFGVVLAVMLAISTIFPSNAFNSARVVMDGRLLTVNAILTDDRIFVPADALEEIFGSNFRWVTNYDHIAFSYGENLVLMPLDAPMAVVNGVPTKVSAPPRIIDSVVFLPLAFVAQTLGKSINWNPLNNTAHISTGNWHVATFAGIGNHGSADGENAMFNLPHGVFGSPHELFVADRSNNLIRGISPDGITRRVSGNILTYDNFGFPAGGLRDGAASEALFNRPRDGIVDSSGRIFIADTNNHSIRMIYGSVENPRVATFAGNGQAGHRDGRGGNARFNRPSAMVMGANGTLYIADTLNHVIRRIDFQGNVTTIAGVPGVYGIADGYANQALFNAPTGIALMPDGLLAVADTSNHLIRIVDTRNSIVSTFAGTLTMPQDAIDGWDDMPLGGFADGFNAMFNQPSGLTMFGDILLVADTANHRIRAILPSGEVYTLAGTGDPDYINGLPHEAAFHFPMGLHIVDGTLFVADTGNNTIRNLQLLAD